MSEEEQKKEIPEKKKRKRPVLKVILITFTMLVALLLLAELILVFFAGNLFRSVVRDFVESESRGVYQISFDDLNIEPFSGYIYMSNFELSSDSVRYRELSESGEIQTALYGISLKEIKVEGLSFRQLIASRKLSLESLRLVAPGFRILEIPEKINDTTRKIEILKHDLYRLVNPYFSSVKVERFDLEKGFFSLKANQNELLTKTGAERISFNIRGFLVDSVEYAKKENLFYSREIKLSIFNYSLQLNDGIHEVFVEKAVLAPRDSLMLVQNAYLRPMQHIRYVEGMGLLTEARVGMLKLTGIDLYEAWNENEIRLSHIILQSPSIRLFDHRTKTQKTKADEQTDFSGGFYGLIKGHLKLLSFDTLSIRNAKFAMHLQNQRVPAYDVREFNMITSGFLLDSAASERNDKIFFSDDISLSLNKMKFSVMNHSHFLTADSLFASTLEQHLIITGFRLMPAKKTSGSNINADIKLRNLSFEGVDFTKVYNFGSLSIDRISIDAPQLDIRMWGQNKSERIDTRLAYYLVSDFVHSLETKHIRVSGAEVSLKQTLPENKSASYQLQFGLNLYNFLVDRATVLTTKSLFFAEGFDLNMTNFSAKTPKDLHQIKLDSLFVSSPDSLLRMSGFSYTPRTSDRPSKMLKAYDKTSLSDIFIERLNVSGVDLKRAFYKQAYSVDKVLLKDFNIYLRAYPELKSRQEDRREALRIRRLIIEDSQNSPIVGEAESINSFRSQFGESVYASLNELFYEAFSFLNIKQLDLSNGYLYYANTDTMENVMNYTEGRVSTTAFDICFNDTIFSDDEMPLSGILDFSVRDFKHFNNEKNLNLKAGYLKYLSADSAFHIENFRMLPAREQRSDSTKSRIYIMAPVIDLQGVGIDALLKNKRVELNALNIPKLYFDMELPAQKDKMDEDNFKVFRLPDSLSGLGLNFLGIREGHFRIRPFGGESIIGQTRFVFDAEDITDDPTNYSFPLKYHKAILRLTDSYYHLPDSQNMVHIDSLYFSMHKNFLHANMLSFGPDTTKNKDSVTHRQPLKNELAVDIDELELKGLNILNLIFDKYLNLAVAEITNPSVRFVKNIESESVADISTRQIEQQLRDVLQKAFVKFKVGTFSLHNASVSYSDATKKEQDTITVKNIHSEITNFDAWRTDGDSVMFLSDDVRLSIRNFDEVLPDSFYRFSFSEAGLSLKEKQIYLNQGRLLPMYGKYEFGQEMGKQKARMEIDDINLNVLGLDFRSLIDSQAIKADLVEISDLNMKAFKDKHIPEDTLRRPPDFVKLLMSTQNDIDIREVKLENISIVYEQNSELYDKTGLIAFEDMTGSVTNITNIDSLIKNNRFMRARLTTQMQNEADLRVSFRFPLDSTESYVFVGLVDTFDLRSLNEFTENTILLSIDEGRSNKISFHVTVFDTYAEGKMHFFYNDLKIGILDTTAARRSFTSAIANVVLPGDNPKNRFSKLRDGTIYALDLPYKNEFYLWAQAVLSGALSSVALEPKEVKAQKKLKRKMERVFDKEKRREARRIRKEKKRLENALENEQ